MSNPQQKFDLVGPTVDDDVRRLIRRYGTGAVKEAVRQQAKSKRGVKAKPDWLDLEPILKQDAARFLEGGNPFTERGNRTIAKEVAEDRPGQSNDATFDRVRKKLIRDRRYYTLVHAAWLSEISYPHAAHLNVLRALVRLGRHGAWADHLLNAQSALADFVAKYGPPAAHLTMREVEDAAANAIPAEPKKNDGNILQRLLDTTGK